MAAKTKTRPKKSFFSRHWHLKHFLIGFFIIVIAIVGLSGYSKWKISHRQHQLQPFYDTTGLSLQGPMGQVVRSQSLGVIIKNGSAERILYRTQKADGSVTFSSGMLFIPNNTNAGLPRPVVAWAHGTVGMGDQCAPSRIDNPIGNIDWVSDMLAKGWVVTATDYAGLGTPGIEGYLVGGDEARDVLNSVRAARSVSAAQIGDTYTVFGHSQGGHSAIFTAAQASSYAPELHLVGTAAAAPATELLALIGKSSGNTLGWAIGPEILTAWPASYPQLDPHSIATDIAYKNYKKIAGECIASAALQGIARDKLKQKFFKTEVGDVPAWRAAATAQTTPILPSSQPLFIAESLTDQVIAPGITAAYIQRSCQAGDNVTSAWVNNVSHQDLAGVVSPQVISWLADRFAGKPAIPNCSQMPPVTPAAL